MKLLVLGATGGVGLEIVRQGIERGHSVTAFVRKSESLKSFGENIAVVEGDLLDGAQLGRVIKGQDAVLSSFGPRVPISKTDRDLLQRFALALTGAMLSASVRRVIVVSTAFLFDSVIPPTRIIGRLFFSDLVDDASRMEETFRSSGLDWTIVRPPRLTDKPRTEKYRAREGHLPHFGFFASRADVADFMIKAAEKRSSVGKIVGVCN